MAVCLVPDAQKYKTPTGDDGLSGSALGRQQEWIARRYRPVLAPAIYLPE
jgi:hypothetical protein